MLIAYNNDIEFRSRWYHIQTEDNGIKDGHVTTTVFFSGQILDSKTTSYLDAISGITDPEEQNKIIKNVMTAQHKLFYAKLYEGSYEELVSHAHKAGAAGGINAHRTSQTSAQPVKPMSKIAAPAAGGRAEPSPANSRLGKPDILRASQQLPSANKNLGSLPPLASSKLGVQPLRAASADQAKSSARRPNLMRALDQSKAVKMRAGESRAWRGVDWSKDDVAVDALVALLLTGNEP